MIVRARRQNLGPMRGDQDQLSMLHLSSDISPRRRRTVTFLPGIYIPARRYQVAVRLQF